MIKVDARWFVIFYEFDDLGLEGAMSPIILDATPTEIYFCRLLPS